MKEVRAYKFSLVFPLLIPALLAPLLLASDEFPRWLNGVLVLTVFSGVIGGIPYLVLVVLLLRWARGKNEVQLRRALLVSPFLMLPIFWLFLGLVALFRANPASPLSEFGEALLFYTPFILGFGYGYIILVFGAVFVFWRMGMISRSNAI